VGGIFVGTFVGIFVFVFVARRPFQPLIGRHGAPKAGACVVFEQSAVA
jgi:hypothetical protein